MCILAPHSQSCHTPVKTCVESVCVCSFFILQAKDQKETSNFESEVRQYSVINLFFTPCCWVFTCLFQMACDLWFRLFQWIQWNCVVFLLIFLPFFCCCYLCHRLSHDFRIWTCGLQGWAHYFAWAVGERTWQWARHGPYSHQVRYIKLISKSEYLKLLDSSFC